MVHGLLILVASLAVGHTGFSNCGVWAQWLQLVGSRAWASVVVGHRLSCPVTCVIFPQQGSNLCLLHWQVDS